jgi:hypothetical protein
MVWQPATYSCWTFVKVDQVAGRVPVRLLLLKVLQQQEPHHFGETYHSMYSTDGTDVPALRHIMEAAAAW